MPLAPAVSAVARQSFKTAFEDLNRTISPGDSRDFSQITIQHVKKEALDIENQLAARQSLRNMRRLMPLFKGLEHYSKVVDTLCNGTPYLPWIWAPVSLILRVASEYVEAFEQVIKGYAKIAASLGRFEMLNIAFIRDASFQESLAVFYTDILEFHKHAYKFVRRSGWRLLFLTSWGRFQRRFDNILEDLKEHGALIDQEANARNIVESQNIHQDLRAWREESLTKVSEHEKEQSAQRTELITSWMNISESDQLTIFDSISSEGSEYPGTCGWVLQNSKVRSWCQRKPDTAVLWLQGTLGSGKSVLAAQLVKFIERNQQFVIRHFCTYRYPSSTMYEQIIKSLLIQLLRKDGDLVAHVYEKFVLAKKAPTVNVLEQLLQELLKSLCTAPGQAEYIWVLIDGLNECEKDKQIRLVDLINHITKSSLSSGLTCKILISNRTPPIPLARLRRRQIISLTEEKASVQGAIRHYARRRLNSLHEKRFSQLSVGEDDIGEIEDAISVKSDGMFLYARLILDYLSRNIFYSCEEIKASVQSMPEELKDFYRKLLTQILVQLDDRSVDRVRCILGWVAFAKRPLRKLEFLSAISFSSGDPDVSQLAPWYILDVCGSLVEERHDTTLAFIHISVKDFLQMSSSNLILQEQEILLEHGITTLACLISGARIFRQASPQQDKYVRVVKGLHGLHVYSTEYWTEYVLSYSDIGRLEKASSLFGLAYQLASELEESWGACNPLDMPNKNAGIMDERLDSLLDHPILFNLIQKSLRNRSRKQLESEFLESDETRVAQAPSPIEGIAMMLVSYQAVVKTLLNLHTCPGVSSEELEVFKNSFRTSAFTCRLNSCSRATLGFESEILCREHEMSHVQSFLCEFPGCQYPRFPSAQALKNHARKHRDRQGLARPIRSRQDQQIHIGSTLPNQQIIGSQSTDQDDIQFEVQLFNQNTQAFQIVLKRVQEQLSTEQGISITSMLSRMSPERLDQLLWGSTVHLQRPPQRLSRLPGQIEPPELIFLMDSMDLPPETLQTSQAPGVKKWGHLKINLGLSPRMIPQQIRMQLNVTQTEQFQRLLQKIAQMNNWSVPSPVPEGGQSRGSPNPTTTFMSNHVNPNMNPHFNMAQQQMNGMRPPSSHPGQSFNGQMNPQQMRAAQRAAQQGQQQQGQQQQGQQPQGAQGNPQQWQPGPNGRMVPLNMQQQSPGIPQGTPQEQPSQQPRGRSQSPPQQQTPQQQQQQLQQQLHQQQQQVQHQLPQQLLQAETFPNLTPQQPTSLSPEQKNRAATGDQMQGPADNLARLKAIGQEEQRQSQSEILVDIPMSPQELADTGARLQRIVLDMSKISRGISKWYAVARDDARAKMFFRTRLRIIKQFADGEKMTVLKSTFSIRASEIDQARVMLESIAKDLVASVYGPGIMKSNSQQQSTSQTQNQPQSTNLSLSGINESPELLFQ